MRNPPPASSEMIPSRRAQGEKSDGVSGPMYRLADEVNITGLMHSEQALFGYPCANSRFPLALCRSQIELQAGLNDQRDGIARLRQRKNFLIIRSARSSFAPEAVSFQAPTIL